VDRYDIATIALDMKALLSTVAGEPPTAQAGPGLRVGHVHLHVGDIDGALGFYRDVLGFEVMVRIDSAAFVSVNGYHHHVSFNVWLGKDVKPRPAGTAGLRNWVIVLERPEEVQAVRERALAAGLAVEERDGGFLVRDPWETAVVIATTPNA
jgi:catechol 2,3-dioxygenase